jgi:hypothetical protein
MVYLHMQCNFLPEHFVTFTKPLYFRVTKLKIKRPDGFKYEPGDWVFIRIPQIAKSEWHPFTIRYDETKNFQVLITKIHQILHYFHIFPASYTHQGHRKLPKFGWASSM